MMHMHLDIIYALPSMGRSERDLGRLCLLYASWFTGFLLTVQGCGVFCSTLPRGVGPEQLLDPYRPTNRPIYALFYLSFFG